MSRARVAIGAGVDIIFWCVNTLAVLIGTDRLPAGSVGVTLRRGTALERGGHALHSGMDVKVYAASVGRNRHTVQDEVQAARVS